MTPVTYRGRKMYPIKGNRFCSGCAFGKPQSETCLTFKQGTHTYNRCITDHVKYIWQSGAKAEVQFVFERLTS